MEENSKNNLKKQIFSIKGLSIAWVFVSLAANAVVILLGLLYGSDTCAAGLIRARVVENLNTLFNLVYLAFAAVLIIKVLTERQLIGRGWPKYLLIPVLIWLFSYVTITVLATALGMPIC